MLTNTPTYNPADILRNRAAARAVLLLFTAAGKVQGELQEDIISVPLECWQDCAGLINLFVPLPCHGWSQSGVVFLQGSHA